MHYLAPCAAGLASRFPCQTIFRNSSRHCQALCLDNVVTLAEDPPHQFLAIGYALNEAAYAEARREHTGGPCENEQAGHLREVGGVAVMTFLSCRMRDDWAKP